MAKLSKGKKEKNKARKARAATAKMQRITTHSIGKNNNKKVKSSNDASSAPSSGTAMPMNKALGQHLLRNPGVLDKIIAAADIKPTDVLMEIGPGTGNLTIRMCRLASKVLAIEFDPRMAAEVKKRALVSNVYNLSVINGDAMKTPWPIFDVCVANLPYQISSPFTFKLLAHLPRFRCSVIMFQLEFGERLVAPVGDPNYGRLTLNANLHFKVSRVCKVDRKSFNPPPKVDSIVVKFTPKTSAISINFDEWDGLLRICFTRRNKTLRAAFHLKSVLRVLHHNWQVITEREDVDIDEFKDSIDEILKKVLQEDFEKQRASQTSMEKFLELLYEFNSVGVHFLNVGSSGNDDAMAD